MACPAKKKKGDYMKKIQMTVNEVMEDMRKHGLRMSPKKFNIMVDAGIFPFVNVLYVSDNGRRTQVIFRREYEAWRDNNLGVNV